MTYRTVRRFARTRYYAATCGRFCRRCFLYWGEQVAVMYGYLRREDEDRFTDL